MITCQRCGDELVKIQTTDIFVSRGIGGYMQYCPDQRMLAANGNTNAIKHIPKEINMKNGPELTEEDQFEIGLNDLTNWPPPVSLKFMKGDYTMKPDFVTIDEMSEDRKPASIINNSVIMFVTIGVPFSSIPIMQKVSIFVDLEKETVVQAVKRLRKMVADNIENYGWVRGTNFNPSQLYYEAYENVTDLVPLYCSVEAPVLRQAC